MEDACFLLRISCLRRFSLKETHRSVDDEVDRVGDQRLLEAGDGLSGCFAYTLHFVSRLVGFNDLLLVEGLD